VATLAKGLASRFRRSRGPLLSYRRRGGLPPPDNEILTVEESGAFRLWRSIVRLDGGTARIGRFAGKLAPDELSRVRTAFDGWKGDAAHERVPPDTPMETIRFRGGELRIPAGTPGPPGVGAALVHVRALVDSLTAHPEAAIELALDKGDARLLHAGTGVLRCDLSRASIRAVRWDGDAIDGSWSARVEGPRSVDPGPGWSYALPFAHGLAGGTAMSVAVEDILAFDGDFWVACVLESRIATGPSGGGD